MSDLGSVSRSLKAFLSTGQFLDVSSEASFHDSICKAVQVAGHPVKREFRVSPRDRFDLWLPDEGVLIEIKLRPRLEQIVRQLQKYASHEIVKGMILVSVTIPPGFPESISLKPVRAIGCWPYLL